MKRRRVIIGAGVLALAAAPWLVALANRPHVFDRAERLQQGMSESEVIAIMGRPPDGVEDDVWYPKYHFRADGTRVEPKQVRGLTWSAGGETIQVQFFDGRAIDAAYRDDRPKLSWSRLIAGPDEK
jgi:hypothetical protein